MCKFIILVFCATFISMTNAADPEQTIKTWLAGFLNLAAQPDSKTRTMVQTYIKGFVEGTTTWDFSECKPETPNGVLAIFTSEIRQGTKVTEWTFIVKNVVNQICRNYDEFHQLALLTSDDAPADAAKKEIVIDGIVEEFITSFRTKARNVGHLGIDKLIYDEVIFESITTKPGAGKDSMFQSNRIETAMIFLKAKK